MRVMGLEKYDPSTVRRDRIAVIENWQKSSLNDTDKYVQLELERIDFIISELWSQWEQSKLDSERTTNVKRGKPMMIAAGETKGTANDGTQNQRIKTTGVEERKSTEPGLGDPRYIAEIRAQMVERRKLLGLYAPEKKDVTTGGKSFADYLVQSGLLNDAESQIASVTP